MTRDIQYYEHREKLIPTDVSDGEIPWQEHTKRAITSNKHERSSACSNDVPKLT